jgi:hypothetical protein
MGPRIRLLACPLALLVLLPAPATSGASTSAGAQASAHSLLQSRQLWATIDFCNPPDQAHYVGVRGSMPGDGRASDSLYMRFRLQYVNATTGQWTDFARGPAPSWVAVGSARSAQQGGRSFQVRPNRALTLRGVVSFQWRQGSTVLVSASRVTTAGRESVKGSDPAGFSAATCRIA